MSLPGSIGLLSRTKFTPSGTSPVGGPTSGGSTDNALVRWDGTTGKIIQNGVVTEADLTGTLTGAASQTTTTAVGIGYTNQPLNDGVEILSSSAADVQTATVIGTTTGGNVTVVESIVLTGTTFVSTLKVNWGQVLAIKLSSAAVGTITVRKATGDATITTLAPSATSSGVTTVTNTAAYNRVVSVVADGATTKQFGFGGTNSAGTQIYDSVALTGATPIVSNSAFNTLTEMYRGDLEAARTVTETSNSTFSLVGGTTGQLDINSLGVSLPSTQTLGLQIYNTADQVTAFERVAALFSGNIFELTSAFGTGGTLRPIHLGISSVAGVSTSNRYFSMGNSSPFASVTLGSTSSAAITFFNINGTSTATSGAVIGYSITPTYNQASGAAANTDLKIARVETALGSGVQAFLDFYAGAAGTTQKFTLLNTGIMSTYAGVATAGWGSPAIYANGTIAATTNARSAAVATYTVGASDGTFVVSGNVNVTTSTTHSFSLDCVYTDETNTSRTLVIPMAQLAGSFVATGLITNVTGAGPYESASMTIRCKASTSITIRPSAGGTYTTVVYNVNGTISQIA